MSMSMNESPKGRPFFRSPDDLYDDEYYDEFYPEKKRRLTHDQVCYICLYTTPCYLLLSLSLFVWNKVEVVEKCRRSKCWRRTLRKRTNWSQRGNPNWPRSWGCNRGRWLCGSRIVELGGRQSNWKGTTMFLKLHMIRLCPTMTQ